VPLELSPSSIPIVDGPGRLVLQLSEHGCPRSSDVVGLLPRQQQATTIVVLNPRPGDVSLSEQRSRRGKPRSKGSSTPLGGSPAKTLEGSPFVHILPSPPPPLLLAPLRVVLRCPHFDMWVILHTAAMATTSEDMSNALVTVIGALGQQ
jgi:hypothetical protein